MLEMHTEINSTFYVERVYFIVLLTKIGSSRHILASQYQFVLIIYEAYPESKFQLAI
jgi:hypothetical protein